MIDPTSTVSSLLRTHATERPDDEALRFGDVRRTWSELDVRVRRLAAALRAEGIGPGDRVVGYLPNIPQAVVAFLAAASIGAVWSACGPEIGLQSAVDRFAQLEPVLLIAVDGYRFGGREHDRRELVADLAARLPSLRAVVSAYRVDLDALRDPQVPLDRVTAPTG